MSVEESSLYAPSDGPSIPVPVDERLVLLRHPQSAAAEQYRVLRARVERAHSDGAQVIAVTSTAAGEGRTTVAANLALALAAGRRRRVLVVDAHVRSPELARVLGLGPAPGLADAILDEAPLDALLFAHVAGGLDVLGAGLHLGRGVAPHTVLEGARLPSLWAELRRRYELVIVDAPPILPDADLLTLGPELDAAMLVVRAGVTPRERIERALIAARDLRMLGYVLLGLDAHAARALDLVARSEPRPDEALTVEKMRSGLGSESSGQ